MGMTTLAPEPPVYLGRCRNKAGHIKSAKTLVWEVLWLKNRPNGGALFPPPSLPLSLFAQEEQGLQAQVQQLEASLKKARDANQKEEAALRQERRKREQFLGQPPPLSLASF